jgi:hypothetical protein
MNLTRFDKSNAIVKKDAGVIDIAWDTFSDIIGERNLKTPLTLEQFEQIFSEISTDEKIKCMKQEILHSFQYDTYAWPLVERFVRERKEA